MGVWEELQNFCWWKLETFDEMELEGPMEGLWLEKWFSDVQPWQAPSHIALPTELPIIDQIDLAKVLLKAECTTSVAKNVRQTAAQLPLNPQRNYLSNRSAITSQTAAPDQSP